MLVDQPRPTRLEQRVQLLDDLFRRGDAAKTLYSHNRIDRILLNATLGLQFLCATSNNFIHIAQSSLDGILPQRRMHLDVWLHAIDLGYVRVLSASKEVEPLTSPRSNVEANSPSVVLDERHYVRRGDLTRHGPQESPEACEPLIFESVEAKEGLEMEVQNEADYGGDDVVRRVGYEEPWAEEI